MENSIAIGLSRQMVLSHALDVTANNIANQSTAGFKASTIRFEEYLAPQTNGSASAAQVNQDISFVIDSETRVDFSQGSLTQTGAPLDFAINGEGFFSIETPAGTRYTRDGHFSISAFGELTNRDGLPVLDDAGSPILLNPNGSPVQLTPEGELQQDGAIIARFGIYTFSELNALSLTGDNLFQYQGQTQPQILEKSALEQGFIENANVSPIKGITDMIKISRAYEQASQLITTTNDLSRDAIRTLTRTN